MRILERPLLACSTSSGILLRQNGPENSWAEQIEMNISLPFPGHLHRVEKKKLPQCQEGRQWEVLLEPGFSSQVFGSVNCFHCLNFPEPLEGVSVTGHGYH